MMRRMFSLVAVLCAAFSIRSEIHAQTTVSERGSYLNVGMGFPYSYGWAYRSSFLLQVSGYYAFKQVGPGVFAVGGLTGLGFWDHHGKDGVRGTAVGVPAVARLRYHYDWGVQNLDTHVGISLGLGVHTFGQVIYPLGGFHFGAQYFFTNTIGVFADLGWDVSAVALGLAVKL
ncbi:MAG: hypothetical protein NZ534_04380, partial [Bacteroidia bacterium]|nr:hypothetical protein [Bacteroidia bacterium]